VLAAGQPAQGNSAAAPTPADIAKARKAAEAGDAAAMYSLGVMYFKGEGVPKDYKEAAS
jgi:TPR repeat protein